MIISLWNKISNTGLSAVIDEREGIKIRLLNQLTVATGITTFILFFSGLYLSEGIYVLFERSFTLESKEGEGSTFILNLPLYKNQ